MRIVFSTIAIKFKCCSLTFLYLCMQRSCRTSKVRRIVTSNKNIKPHTNHLMLNARPTAALSWSSSIEVFIASIHHNDILVYYFTFPVIAYSYFVNYENNEKGKSTKFLGNKSNHSVLDERDFSHVHVLRILIS